MFPSTTIAARSSAQGLLRLSAVTRPAVRRVGFRAPNGRRFQSTTQQAAHKAQDATQSPLMAGLAGGIVALSGGYAWYHFSGAKKVVETARTTIETFESAKDKVVNVTPSPTAALGFVRSTISSYAAFLPAGTKETLDHAFDSLDSLSNGPHAKEANQILTDTYNELRTIFSEGGFDQKTAERIKGVIEDKSKALRRLVGDIGQDILDKNPKLAESLKSTGDSAALGELKKLASEIGPEANDLVNDTYKQLSDILKDGAVTDPATIYKATNLIREKLEQARELSAKAAERAWNETYKSVSAEGGLLDKLPEDVRSTLEENADALKRAALGGGGVGSVYELFNMLKKYAGSKDKDAAKKFKEYVEQKVGQGKDSLGDLGQMSEESLGHAVQMVEQYVKSMPGGEKILSAAPPVQDLVNLAKKKSPEARKLMEDTLNDLSEVLNKRLAQAKELASNTKEEGKQRVKKGKD